MWYLTVEECKAFDAPGGQDEVTPIMDGDKVVAVYIYTGHVSGWREPRRKDHGSPTYGRLVEAADARANSQPTN